MYIISWDQWQSLNCVYTFHKYLPGAKASTTKVPRLMSMMTCIMPSCHGHTFRIIGPLWGESIGNVKLGYFFVSLSKLWSKRWIFRWYKTSRRSRDCYCAYRYWNEGLQVYTHKCDIFIPVLMLATWYNHHHHYHNRHYFYHRHPRRRCHWCCFDIVITTCFCILIFVWSNIIMTSHERRVHRQIDHLFNILFRLT